MPVPVPVAPKPAPAVNSISDAFAGLMSDPSDSPAAALPEANPQVMPLVIVTAEFGKRWGTTPFDAKISVNCAANNLTTLEQLRRAIPPTYHHVESIPTSLEAIFAATVTSSGSVVLLHVKIQPVRKTCDIVIKSNVKEVCTKEGTFVASAIAAFRG
jgi:hypothetical protein